MKLISCDLFLPIGIFSTGTLYLNRPIQTVGGFDFTTHTTTYFPPSHMNSCDVLVLVKKVSARRQIEAKAARTADIRDKFTDIVTRE